MLAYSSRPSSNSCSSFAAAASAEPNSVTYPSTSCGAPKSDCHAFASANAEVNDAGSLPGAAHVPSSLRGPRKPSAASNSFCQPCERARSVAASSAWPAASASAASATSSCAYSSVIETERPTVAGQYPSVRYFAI